LCNRFIHGYLLSTGLNAEGILSDDLSSKRPNRPAADKTERLLIVRSVLSRGQGLLGILKHVRKFVTDERRCKSADPAHTTHVAPPPGEEVLSAMAYVITQPCIGTKDASCVEVCPVDCIHSDDNAEQYFINPDECIDCGVCAEVCPVEAIFFEDDVPEQWASFILTNREYFEK
jgi:ferredoxin